MTDTTIEGRPSQEEWKFGSFYDGSEEAQKLMIDRLKRRHGKET